MNKQPAIAFIGGGNMARSLIGGLLANDYPARQLYVSDPQPQTSQYYQSLDTDIVVSTENTDIVEHAEVIVFAVKPQILNKVATELASQIRGKRKLFVSIAAGIRETSIRGWLGVDEAIVRCMPNTPALVQAGATALFANQQVSQPQKETAEMIMRAAGITVWIDDESLMDAVTALSGSGPAYFFLMMESMQIAAEKLGLSANDARLLTLETALGAAKLAIESGEDPATLRRRVTSKGGTTEAALKVLNDEGYSEIIANAMRAAADRSAELAKNN